MTWASNHERSSAAQWRAEWRVTVVEITGTDQHESWLNKVLPPVEEIRPNLWSIPVPMPHSPLRYVSVYAMTHETGVTLIDAGWDSDDSWQALLDGLTLIGTSITDVQGVLVTHKHFDHIGLARRVRDSSGAWVGLHPADQDPTIAESRDRESSHKAALEWLVGLGASTGRSGVAHDGGCIRRSRSRCPTARSPHRRQRDHQSAGLGPFGPSTHRATRPDISVFSMKTAELFSQAITFSRASPPTSRPIATSELISWAIFSSRSTRSRNLTSKRSFPLMSGAIAASLIECRS